MSLTLCCTREKDTPEERSSFPCDGATRPRHAARLLQTWGASWQHGDATSPLGGRLRPRVEPTEECKNSRRTGPMTARPASTPARYSTAIEVPALVCAGAPRLPRRHEERKVDM